MHKPIQICQAIVRRFLLLLTISNPSFSEKQKLKDREDVWGKIEEMAAMNISKIPGHEKDALLVVRERSSKAMSPTRPMSLQNPVLDDDDDDDMEDEAADTLTKDVVRFHVIYNSYLTIFIEAERFQSAAIRSASIQKEVGLASGRSSL